MGSISYIGGLRNNAGQSKLSKAKSGKLVLDLLVAEQHRGKNSSVSDKFKDPNKGADDWVNTTTSWHRVRVFGESAERLARDPRFNHGALLTISAVYEEDEKPWTSEKDGLTYVGRSETVFSDRTQNDQWVEIHQHDGNVFGAKEQFAKPLWDGVSELPALGGSGGGGGAPKEYADEGF